MSLGFAGPGGSFETRWIFHALLRDNVQHHLGGVETSFPSLARVSEALGGGSVRIRAAALREEVLEARALLPLPRRALAVSRSTAAVFDRRWPAGGGETVLFAAAGSLPAIPGAETARTLGDLLGPLVESLLAVTEGAVEDSVVEVFDV